jgi:hypothetical protein
MAHNILSGTVVLRGVLDATAYGSSITSATISSSATATLYGLTTYDISAQAISATSVAATAGITAATVSASNAGVFTGGTSYGAAGYATISSAGAIAGTSLSSSADATIAGGVFISGTLGKDGIHVRNGIRCGIGSGGDTSTGVISGSHTATLYALTTHGIVGTTIQGTSLSSSADATIAGGVFISGTLGKDGIHVRNGIRCGIGSGGDTSTGVISGSHTATLYGLITHDIGAVNMVASVEIDAASYRGGGALLQGITGSLGTALEISHALDGGSLARGLNYFTASTNPVTVKMPSASYGDQVIVKASSGVTATNYIKITGAIAQWGEAGSIDDQTDIKITSPHGSVALVYVKDSDWRVI